jgi:hypothetical protein
VEEPERVKHSRPLRCRIGLHRWRFLAPLDFLGMLILERCSRCGKMREVFPL